jgi:hypothetical protein
VGPAWPRRPCHRKTADNRSCGFTPSVTSPLNRLASASARDAIASFQLC